MRLNENQTNGVYIAFLKKVLSEYSKMNSSEKKCVRKIKSTDTDYCIFRMIYIDVMVTKIMLESCSL